MLWASTFLTFLTCSSGSFGQYVLTQPPSVSVPPGQNAQISCSGDNIDNNLVHWYQQKPGKAPVLIIYNDSERPSGISDRFSGTNSGNPARLSIAMAQVEDEADYYCQVCDIDTDQYVFGPGTHLTVLGQPTAPPTVHVFHPSQEEIKSRKKATLVCLIDAFYPGAVQVDWLADGTAISSGVETTKPTKQGDKYVASSYLTLGQTDWESHSTYTCKVRHEGKDFEKVVTKSSCA